MRPLVIDCLIVAFLLPGCAEQRQAFRQMWSPNGTDEEGKPFPRWVRYDDFEDRHPYLTTTGWAVLVTAIVVAVVAGYVLVQVIEANDGRLP
jgi:hypothetical protein